MQLPRRSLLGKAVHYTFRQWHKLLRHLEDGRLSIDNNCAERAVKPFVIGRKNWMFSHTEKGATASATLYNLVETAKANGLVPLEFLTYLLSEPPKLAPETDRDCLIPWNVALPTQPVAA